MAVHKRFSKRTPRRGGAMSKSVAQLLNELDDDPSEASLRNVLSELKESGHAWTVEFAHSMERGINAHKAAGTLTGQLLQGGISYVKDRMRKGRIKDGGRRKTRRRGGAMSKTLRELVVDLERDPSESTLRNVLTDLKESPRAMLRANAEDQERALDAPIREEDEPRPRRVRRIIGIMLPMMRALQYVGGRRKTTRRDRGGRRKRSTRRR
jgi:hypothetical protein